MIFAALVVGAAIAGCSSTGPPVTAPTTAPAVTSALHAWGEEVILSDGATLAVSQPRREGPEVVYTVTVHNLTQTLLTNVTTPDITADGLAVDNGETIDNDPGYQLGVTPDNTLTYTVHRTKFPATAKTITLTMYVNFSNGFRAVDRPVWVGDIR